RHAGAAPAAGRARGGTAGLRRPSGRPRSPAEADHPPRRGNRAPTHLRRDLCVDGDDGGRTLPVKRVAPPPRNDGHASSSAVGLGRDGGALIRSIPLVSTLLLGGCNLFVEPSPPPGSCNTDKDCPAPQRCYVDGCGTLPDDLLAEVITSAPTGVTAVDQPLGAPFANMPLVLPDQPLLQLTVRRGT